MHDELLQLLIEIEQSTSPDTWFPKLLRLTNHLGLESTLAGIIDTSKTDLSTARIFSNYNPIWRDIYDKNGYGNIDPVVEHARSNVTPILWRDEMYKTREQKEFLEEAKSFNLDSGVTFPLHGPSGEFGTLSFQAVATGSEEKAHIYQSMPFLSVAKDTILQKLILLLKPASSDVSFTLSRRESEILKWSAVGKTTWEISIICNCSEANIEYHMKNIRSKFGVNTRRAACIKAIALGLIAI